MAVYTCLLLDVDNTLLDFNLAERLALTETLIHYELPHDSETLDVYHKVNRDLWNALAKGEINREKLFSVRFRKFMQEIAAGDAAKGREMNEYYEGRLAGHAEALPGAVEALRELGEVATLAIVSNGTAKVQESRIRASGIGAYMDGVFISEQVGAAKPSSKLFDAALKELGVANRSRVLVVGDDLLADIKGGINSGLDTCWVNFEGQEPDGKITPKYEVRSFEELYRIVMEPEELENIGNRNRRHMND